MKILNVITQTRGPLVALLIAACSQVIGFAADEENVIVRNRNSSFYDNPINRVYTGRSPFNNQPMEPAPAPPPTVRPAPAPRPVPAPPPKSDRSHVVL